MRIIISSSVRVVALSDVMRGVELENLGGQARRPSTTDVHELLSQTRMHEGLPMPGAECLLHGQAFVQEC